MARKTALTNDNLIALGPDKLAKLVADEVQRNASFKRLVVAALAGAQGPKAVAAIVDRRLAGLERARGFVDWEKRKAFAADIAATLSTITDELGAADPAAAADRLIRFLVCAAAVFERVDDSSGQVQEIFHKGADALPDLAAKLPDDDRVQLVGRLVPLLAADEFGLIEAVVRGTITQLPTAGLTKIDATLAAEAKKDAASQGGKLRDWERLSRRDRLVRTRQAIADARGDVDAFIVLEDARPDGRQDNLAIAERLLAAGRAAEALDRVRQPGRRGLRAMTAADIADASAGTDLPEHRRVRLEISVLTALGRKDAAQDLRWRTFETDLDDEILRHYIVHLADFEEFDALERAFACAKAHPHRYGALAFFLAWPRLDLAAKLVIEHRGTWAGQHYGMLLPAAEALRHDHPAAATVLYRALLDDILTRARSPAYGHGARYLAALDDLDTKDIAAAGLTSHESYRAALRRSHGRKAGFWSLVDDAT